MTAFTKWLNTQTKRDATQYLFECLRDGGSDSFVWSTFEALDLKTINPLSMQKLTNYLLNNPPIYPDEENNQ